MKFPVRQDAHFSRQEIGQMFFQSGQIGAKPFPDICRIIHAAHPLFHRCKHIRPLNDLSNMAIFAIFNAYKSGKIAYMPYFYNLYWVFYFPDTITFT